ncbi:MAG: glycosyltransferase [Pseudomonadota bacterium]
MKIVHLETGRHRYGGPQQVLQLMNRLAESGHDNTLIGATDSEVLAHARLAGHSIEAIATIGDADVSLVPRLARRFARLAPDVVHVHSRRGGDLYGGPAARLAGLPSVLTRRVDNPLSVFGARWRLRPYRRVIAISEAVRDVLTSAGVAAERIVVIRDALDVAPLVLSPERDWFVQTFGVPKGVPLIGVIAQFIPRKGHRYVFDAMPAVLERLPAARLLLFGRGPLEAELRALAHEYGLAEQVVFGGFRRDMARILPCLDLVVHPATAEGMGVALLEAAAAAVPVVAFAAGGVSEVVVDGETGLLVPVGDSAGLGAAIAALLTDRRRGEALGVAARRRIEQAFSVAEHAARHEALYAAVMAEQAEEREHNGIG